jgi:hypothetical protein
MVAERKSALLVYPARCNQEVPGLPYKVMIEVVSGGQGLKVFCRILNAAKDIRCNEAKQAGAFWPVLARF